MSVSVGLAAPSRTRRLLQQTGIGLLLRIGALGATFVAAPLMLHLLGSSRMGVWLVLQSVFQWMTMFDLGIAAGARNEIARSAAVSDRAGVRRAVSTGWYYTVMLALGIVFVACAILALPPVIPWIERTAFAATPTGLALWLVVTGACASFALSYIQSVFAALEQPVAFSAFSLLSNLLFLAGLGLATAWALDSVTSVSAIYVAAMLLANGYLIRRFKVTHPDLTPTVESIDRTARSAILGFGIRLFVIQIAAVIIFTTSRVMVSTLLGPEQVVAYDAAFKLFAVPIMIHTLVMSSYWSSFTQALTKRELAWVTGSLRRLELLMLPLAVGCGIIAIACPTVISHWLGEAQVVDLSFYALFAVMTVLSCWSNIHAYFLNGAGDVKVQLPSALAAAVINIPATYFFTVTLKMGLSGIVLGTICSLSLFSVLGPIRTRQVLRTLRHEHTAR